jgi:hypothetical protein
MASSIKLSPLTTSSASPPSITTSPPPPTTTQQQPLLSETASSQNIQQQPILSETANSQNIQQKPLQNIAQISSDFNPSPVPPSIEIPKKPIQIITQPPTIEINTESSIQLKNNIPIKSVSAPTPKMTETNENIQITKSNDYLQIIAAIICSALGTYLIRYLVLRNKIEISELYLNIGLSASFILLFVILYYLINKFF